MKTTTLAKMLVLGLVLVVCRAGLSQAASMGTGFTYQDRLIDINKPVDGLYDLQFKLFDAASDGNQIGGDVNKPDVDVIDGHYTVQLDFGSDVFNGDARWLEIGVRPGDLNDPNVYNTLSPRQEVTPTPYALHTHGVSLGTSNTLVGLGAGAVNANVGNCNTFLGSFTGYYNTTGYSNTFLGTAAGHSNTIGTNNTFVGREAGIHNTTGSCNTFSGAYAGSYNTEGVCNTFSGYGAGWSNTTSNWNTFLGAFAGSSNTEGGGNTFLGNCAGRDNTTGNNNTFSGCDAGVLNTTGHDNTFLGIRAGTYNTEGAVNTFIGSHAGVSNTTGNYNTFSGYVAGYSNTTGICNTFLGTWAGYSNTTGNGNVFLGCKAGYNETGSNKLYIANSDVNPPLIYGEFDTGNVGIGTTTPKNNLDVEGAVAIGAGYSGKQTASNNGMIVQGKVGIGTANPARKLHVKDVIRLEPRSSAPLSPAEGDMYMDSTDHKLKVYDGRVWRSCW